MGEAWSNQLIQLLILSLPGGFSGLFGYSPAPGPGNLVISITNQAGTDPYGNPYPAGVCVGPASGAQVNLTGGNPAKVAFPLNDSVFAVDPAMYAGTSAPPPAAARYAQVLIDGPKLAPGAHDDYTEIQINSPNADGSSAASLSIVYYDAAGGINGYLTADNKGLYMPAVNTLAASVPGTGTSVSNPAQSELWHLISYDAGWTQQPGYPQPQYRYLPTGDLQMSGVVFQSFASAAAKQLNLSNPLPVGYRPLRQHDWKSGDLIGQRCHMAINTAGVIVATPPTGATFPNNYYADIEGIVANQTT